MLKDKLKELESLVDKYKEEKKKFNEIYRLFNVETNENNPIFIKTELFFSANQLKKLNILNLIYSAKFANNSNMSYPDKVNSLI